MVDQRADGGEPIGDRSASDAPQPTADERRAGPDLIGDLRERPPVASREPSPDADRPEFSFEDKIVRQMAARGWTAESVAQTINHPHRTAETTDYRRRDDGLRNSDPATAYLNADGSYVVRNDVTGDIVQVNNRNKPNWKRPFSG